jgi:hypothetical protein
MEETTFMNNRFYIQDPTLKKYVYFDVIQDVVKHLEGLVQRHRHVSRTQYMQNLIDLGYGYDDPSGATFTRAMSETYDIGILKDGLHVKTDVHTGVRFDKPEFGQ